MTSPDVRFFQTLLLPGDVLLFDRGGLYGWLIKHASNRPETHTECYIGKGRTVASRNGKGVGTYDLDPDGLSLILRPRRAKLDWARALGWQRSVDGAKYDWTGLWRAFIENKWGKPDGRFWCSEHTCEFQRQLGVEPFNADIPADSITPGDFAQSGAYLHVYPFPR